jgi:UPF0755 protein
MNKKITIKIIANSLILSISLLIILAVVFLAPPDKFEIPVTVEIEEGSSLNEIGNKLHREGVIRSPLWFKNFVIFYRGERKIPAGQYYFTHPEPVYKVALKLVNGEYEKEHVRVTIIEGWNLFQVADYLEEKFVNFNRDDFFKIAKEGYLAPDTYFFFPLSTTEEIIKKMEENFNLRVEKIREEMEIERPLEEIIILASILEAEANTVESKRKISDILWRRLDIEMPLQVDATFIYVNNKNTYELTLEDLEIDNPYNSYKNKGLPPTPICNPSENAIRAAINPIENQYWYFLSDLAGNMYYAKDFEEHQYNRANYLRQ